MLFLEGDEQRYDRKNAEIYTVLHKMEEIRMGSEDQVNQCYKIFVKNYNSELRFNWGFP